jgi:hypothetical protein
MKRNLLSLISAAAVLVAVVFTGCSREETKDTGTKSVFLKITSAETRVVGSPTTNGAKAAITEGYVFFTNSSGIILKSVTFGAAADYTAAAFTAGQLIDPVPGAANTVYVVANIAAVDVSSLPGTPVGANVSSYLNGTVEVIGLDDATGSYTNIPLYGNGAIVPDVTDYKADIEVAPVASRIELKAITMHESASHVTKFTVKNIFINNYFEESDGTAAGAIKNNGAAAASYVAGSGNYTDLALYDVVGDQVNPSDDVVSGNHYGAIAGTNKVWAYNLLAPATYGGSPGTAVTAAQFPHIIIELTIDEVDDAAYDAYVEDALSNPITWYLTVTNVVPENTANPSAADYLKFEPGKVYQFDSSIGITFTLEDLSPTPEPTNKKVTAKVTVKAWDIVAVDPVF